MKNIKTIKITKRFIAADIGLPGEPVKIICAESDKGKTYVRGAFTLNNADGDFADKFEGTRDKIIELRQSEKGFKGAQILLILPESEYKPLLFKTERALKYRYVQKWIRTTLFSNNKNFYYDSVNPAKIVSCDIFGNAQDSTCGAVISADAETAEEIYKAFEDRKITEVRVISAVSAAALAGACIAKAGCRAVLELGASSFCLNIYLNKMLVSSQTEGYLGLEALTGEITRCLNTDAATVEQMLVNDGFLSSDEMTLATISQKEFTTALSSVFAQIAEPISSRLNAARGKQYYPSKMYITGELTRIKGIAEALGGILNVSAEVVSLKSGEGFAAVINETENALKAETVFASLALGGCALSGFSDIFSRRHTAVIKPVWLKIKHLLKTVTVIYLQILVIILLFSVGNYAFQRLKYERVRTEPTASETLARDTGGFDTQASLYGSYSVPELTDKLTEKRIIQEQLTACTNGLPVKELLTIISRHEKSGLTIDGAKTEFIEIKNESEASGNNGADNNNGANNKNETYEGSDSADSFDSFGKKENGKSGDMLDGINGTAVITLSGTALTSGSVSGFIDELAKIPRLNNYTINNIEESLTDAGTRQLFEVALMLTSH